MVLLLIGALLIRLCEKTCLMTYSLVKQMSGKKDSKNLLTMHFMEHMEKLQHVHVQGAIA